jgi:hypothetical protein
MKSNSFLVSACSRVVESGNRAIDDLVELGEALLPVVGVLRQHDLGAALALDLEGAVADRRGAVGLVAHLLVRLGRDDGAAIAHGDAGEGAERRLGLDLEHVLAVGLHRVDREQRGADLEALRFEVEVPAIDHVVGGELAETLLPLHALAQLDAPGQRIGIGPFGRQHRLDGALGEVDLHQAVEDVVDDQSALDVVADHRTEIAELAAEHADPEVALALRQRRRPAGAEQQAGADGAGRETATRHALVHRCLLQSSIRSPCRILSARFPRSGAGW